MNDRGSTPRNPPNASMAKVAIITRTRERPTFLRRAVESVLAQTFTDWEHWIVNDGGDRVAVDEVLDGFKERFSGRMRVLHLEENVGMQAAANRAIEDSESTYIAIHDDDDTWAPSFLNTCVEYLEAAGPESRYQGVVTGTTRIEERLESEDTLVEVERAPYTPIKTVSLFRVGYENPFVPIAFLYRRSTLETLKGYEERYGPVADMDFNYRFLQQFDVDVIDEPLAFYHWRVDSDVADGAANTFTAHKRRHDRLINELKNDWLRRSRTEGNLDGLVLNVSKFLYENEWVTWYLHDKVTSLIRRAETTEDLARNTATAERLEFLLKQFDANGGILESLKEDSLKTAKADRLERVIELIDQSAQSIEATRAVAEQAARSERVERALELLDLATQSIQNLEGKVARLEARESARKTLLKVGPLKLQIEKKSQESDA